MSGNVRYYAWLLLVSCAVTLLFARTFARERRRIGALAYFSPSFGFYAVYLICFIIRPLVMLSGGLVGYSDDAGGLAQSETVLLLSLLGAVTFYMTFDPPYRFGSAFRLRLLPVGLYQGRPSPLRLRGMVSALLMLSAACSAVFFALIYQLGAVTADFGVNRAVFSAGTAGQGHLFLVNTTAAVALLMALYLHSYHRSPLDPRPLAATGWFLLPNLIVTNRFLITAVLAALLVCWLLHFRSRRQSMPTRSVVLFLGAVALAGSLLGMIRGLGEYQFDESNSVNPLIFFLWTFDMSELLSRTIEYTGDHDFGLIWLQDLLYLYIPRALWTGKPQIYGAIQAQSVIFPELIPSDGIPIATYPIGMFGEGYFTFGVVGVAIALAIVGAVLRRLFSSLHALRQHQPYIGAMLFPVFVLQCLNPLGYYRSVGWFVSLVLFHLWISGIVLGGAMVLRQRRHRHRPRQTAIAAIGQRT